MARVYATSGKLAEFMRELPDNVDMLLRLASDMVTRKARTGVYKVNAAGYPVDPDVIAAFADATCFQVQAWVANNINVEAGSAGLQVVSSSSIDGARVDFDSSAQSKAQNELMHELCQASDIALLNSGIFDFPGIWAY